MSLKLWLPLDGTLENKGISDATVTNNGATIDTDGKIGQCYSFAGSTSSYMTVNNVSIPTDNWSVATWINPATGSSSAANQYAICINGTTASTMKFSLGTYQNSLTLRIASTSYKASSTYTINTWYHFCATYTNKTLKLYINGTLNKTINNTATPSSTNSFYIGMRGGSAGAFNGKLNDIRVYDHVLSAAEVKEISQGLILHYKLDNITDGIQDSSGYGHNGIIVGTPTITSDTVKYSQTISMNTKNTTNHIESIDVLPSTIQTISFWMKKIANSSYVVFAEPSSGLMFGPVGSYAVIKVATSNQTCYSISSPDYIDGEWNHIVVQKDETTYKLWTNGHLRETSGSNYFRHNGTKLYLFNRNYNGNYGANCAISDFRAYVTLLSENEILDLYHTGMKIDNQQNIHTFELMENQSSIKLTKNGQLKCKELIETTKASLREDKDIYTNQIIER